MSLRDKIITIAEGDSLTPLFKLHTPHFSASGTQKSPGFLRSRDFPENFKLELGGLDVPDFRSVLTDGTVRGELGSGSNVHQALAAKGVAVSVVPVGLLS